MYNQVQPCEIKLKNGYPCRYPGTLLFTKYRKLVRRKWGVGGGGWSVGRLLVQMTPVEVWRCLWESVLDCWTWSQRRRDDPMTKARVYWWFSGTKMTCLSLWLPVISPQHDVSFSPHIPEWPCLNSLKQSSSFRLPTFNLHLSFTCKF